VTIRTLDLRSKGREFDHLSGRCQMVAILEWVIVRKQVNLLVI